MITSKITYSGDLRTNAIHVRSSQGIITDAPVDNQGKGEAFSPTDLVCSALCSCMMTIMGQVAVRENILLEGVTAEVTKVMSASPRKISDVIMAVEYLNSPKMASNYDQKINLEFGPTENDNL